MPLIDSLTASRIILSDRLDQFADVELAITEEAGRGDWIAVSSLTFDRRWAAHQIAVATRRAEDVIGTDE
jgi:hypothetical protein